MKKESLFVYCNLYFLQEPTHFKPYKHPYSAGLNGKAGGGTPTDGGKHGNMAQQNYSDSDFYSPPNYNNDAGNNREVMR